MQPQWHLIDKNSHKPLVKAKQKKTKNHASGLVLVEGLKNGGPFSEYLRISIYCHESQSEMPIKSCLLKGREKRNKIFTTVCS